ncbi:MAG: hypothetical protein KGK30_07720, partial [Elusimicrobia bacterium]|nr:hypothetical protein [Elusimicrobiota bacterium]
MNAPKTTAFALAALCAALACASAAQPKRPKLALWGVGALSADAPRVQVQHSVPGMLDASGSISVQAAFDLPERNGYSAHVWVGGPARFDVAYLAPTDTLEYKAVIKGNANVFKNGKLACHLTEVGALASIKLKYLGVSGRPSRED